MQSVTLITLITSASGVLSSLKLTSDIWIKSADFSNLKYWTEFTAVSQVGCVLLCQISYSRGCGHNKFTGQCQVYLESGDTRRWKPQDGFEYFVSFTASRWKDMSHLGYNLALLMPPGKKTWAESRSLCDSLGSRLYVMDNRDKRYAFKIFRNMQGISATRFWVGCNDIAAEGKWLWESGKPVADFWLHGEPNNGEGSQNCGALVSSKFQFGLDDDQCGDTFPSICELVYPDI